MKLSIYCIEGLNTSALHYLRFATLDGIAFRDIPSVLPAVPLTAWTSAWTGLSPEHHGKVPGVKGKKPKNSTIWDDMSQQGVSVALYTEEELDRAEEEDLAVYRVDSIASHIQSGNLDEAQLVLNNIDKLIASRDNPFLILSAIGMSRYSTGLNVDRFLIAREMMLLNRQGGIIYDKSYAYPANYTGSKPRVSHGIVINSMQRSGFVVEMQAMDIAGELLMSLNRTEGIEALAAHQYYDIGAPYYADMPDVVLRSPAGKTCFICSGQKDAAVIGPYDRFAASDIGMVAAWDGAVIENMQTMVDARKMIKRAVKMAGVGEE